MKFFLDIGINEWNLKREADMHRSSLFRNQQMSKRSKQRLVANNSNNNRWSEDSWKG